MKPIKFVAPKNKRSKPFTFLLPVQRVTSRCSVPPTRSVVVRSQLNSPLRTLCHLLADVFHVELLRDAPIPAKVDKKFCEGLLEPGYRAEHPWRRLLKRYSISTRLTVAHSLFMYRKVLGLADAEMPSHQASHDFGMKMARPQGRVSNDFLSHARSVTAGIFRPGWDQDRIDSKIQNFTLPTNACQENSKGKGGARGLKFRTKEITRASCFGGFYERWKCSRESKICPVMTSGKLRMITVPPWRRCLLKPLHEAMYDRLSKENWLLRGEADACRFSGFTRVDGEVFVSGDYESATDNINGHVSKAVLEVILKNSWMVSSSLKQIARDTLNTALYVDEPQENGDNLRTYYHTSRQLMGNLLCFPLLCLINYITFTYSVPRDVPVKINGDDIVFRSTMEECKKWKEGVGSSGLVLSAGKTSVRTSTFSLNSAVFRSSYTGVRRVPFVRSSCLFGHVEEPGAIAGFLTGLCPGVRGEGKRLLQAVCIANQTKQLYRSNRGLEELGVKVPWHTVKLAGLEHREVFYHDLARSPLPVPKDKWMQNAIPKGWVRKWSSEAQDPEFERLLVDSAWNTEPRKRTKQTSDEYWKEINRSGVCYRTYTNALKVRIKKTARMLKTTINDQRKKVMKAPMPHMYGCGVGRGDRWVREEEEKETAEETTSFAGVGPYDLCLSTLGSFAPSGGSYQEYRESEGFLYRADD